MKMGKTSAEIDRKMEVKDDLGREVEEDKKTEGGKERERA